MMNMAYMMTLERVRGQGQKSGISYTLGNIYFSLGGPPREYLIQEEDDDRYYKASRCEEVKNTSRVTLLD